MQKIKTLFTAALIAFAVALFIPTEVSAACTDGEGPWSLNYAKGTDSGGTNPSVDGYYFDDNNGINTIISVGASYNGFYNRTVRWRVWKFVEDTGWVKVGNDVYTYSQPIGFLNSTGFLKYGSCYRGIAITMASVDGQSPSFYAKQIHCDSDIQATLGYPE